VLFALLLATPDLVFVNLRSRNALDEFLVTEEPEKMPEHLSVALRGRGLIGGMRLDVLQKKLTRRGERGFGRDGLRSQPISSSSSQRVVSS